MDMQLTNDGPGPKSECPDSTYLKINAEYKYFFILKGRITKIIDRYEIKIMNSLYEKVIAANSQLIFPVVMLDLLRAISILSLCVQRDKFETSRSD